MTGPEVRGCRPVLVNFAHFRDREEVLSKSKLLRGTNVYITEDLSRKVREHRNELTKFMREVFIIHFFENNQKNFMFMYFVNVLFHEVIFVLA